jgi:tRNA threonylcarbamoyladenosine biosynthesis protein TsaE
MQTNTKNAKETQKLGVEFSQKIKNGGVVGFFGDLGSGKTTLIQGICRGLKIAKRVNSPTFIIARRYTLGKKSNFLFHVDLYRLGETADIKPIGLEEFWQEKNNIVLIEWPEKIVDLLPKNHWEIRLQAKDDDSRDISIIQT